MAYELNVRSDGETPCARCDGMQSHEIVERVDAGGYPLWRNIRRYKQCARCKLWSNNPVDPITRAGHPRTPGVLPRIIVSWALLAAVAGVLVVWFVHRAAVMREYAESPRVGDRWTIRAESWPDEYFENSAKYGVVRVQDVHQELVEIAACNQTGDDQSDVKDRCKTFRAELEAVSLAKVRQFYDDDVIDEIKRSGDPNLRYDLLGLAVGCLVVLMFLHGWRSRRFFAARSRRVVA